VMTSCQLQRLTAEWDVDGELLEGDLILRRGKTVKLLSKLPVCTINCQSGAGAELADKHQVRQEAMRSPAQVRTLQAMVFMNL